MAQLAMADVEGMRDRLQTIAEELADAGIDTLREAIAAGATKRPDAERHLVKARRAVERAIVELDRLVAAPDAEADADGADVGDD
jgi:hypothetical protein